MYAFFAGIFLIACFITEAKEVEYEEDIIIGEPECLQLMATNQGYSRRNQIKFYNSCPKGVWASICVEERPGKFKLHESSTRVPKHGYMDIYTYEGISPVSVRWISGRSKPTVPPGECGLDQL